MTIVTQGPDSVFLHASAKLLDDNRDVASSAWAYDKIIPNKQIKWIMANYVEADNANRNNQYWSLDDLRLAQPTVSYTPLNMNHHAKNIIGTIVSSEMQYPTQDSASDAIFNPYIEVLGAMWKFYNPDEIKEVEKAYDAGALFISMECISDTVSCVGSETACGETFDYAGPISPSYCNHINNRTSNIQFNDPNFLAGGLITPPNRPGWKDAYANDIAKHTTDEESDRLLTAIKAEAPGADLTIDEWESMMYAVQLQRFSKVN